MTLQSFGVLFMLFVLFAAVHDNQGRSGSVRGGSVDGVLVVCGYGAYSILATFFLALGVTAVLIFTSIVPEVFSSPSWRMLVLILGTAIALSAAGLWCSVWRLKRHAMRHRTIADGAI